MFSSSGVKPPASGFQCHTYNASRLLHPYTTDDETILHSEGHEESFTELHGDKKWKEGDEVTRRRRRGVKRGENNLASNQFPKYSAQPGTPREIHRIK